MISGGPVASAFFFQSGGRLRVLDGNGNGTGEWMTLTNHPPLLFGSWARLSVRHDYANQVYSLWLNGALVAEELGFLDSVPSLSQIQIDSFNAVDGVSVSLSKPDALNFDWSTIPELYPGIKHAQLSLTEPRTLFVNVLQIDTHNPDIRFDTTGRHPDWGEPMPDFPQYTIRTERKRTNDYLNDRRNDGLDMVAAINAAPWRPWPELTNDQKVGSVFGGGGIYPYAGELGLTIADGTLIDVPNNRPTLIVEKDWTLRMQSSPAGIDLSNILHAVSGFQFVLQNGVSSGGGTLEPRTGYGLSWDNGKLILMTIDGRRSNSEGASLDEVGEFLRFFGSWTGINMDGGGSTTMALRNPDNGSIFIANIAGDDLFFSRRLRRVGNNLGIYYVGTPEPISFEDWLSFRGVSSGDLNPSADSNADGIPNLLAYLFNIHPLDGVGMGDVNARPKTSFENDEVGIEYVVIEFRVNRHAVNAQVLAERSFTLQADSWEEPLDAEWENIGPDPVTNDPRYRVRIPTHQAERLFTRLRGELIEP